MASVNTILNALSKGDQIKDFAHVVSLGGSTTITLSKTATIAQNITVYFYRYTSTSFVIYI